jgi:hypothetical protein
MISVSRVNRPPRIIGSGETKDALAYDEPMSNLEKEKKMEHEQEIEPDHVLLKGHPMVPYGDKIQDPMTGELVQPIVMAKRAPMRRDILQESDLQGQHPRLGHLLGTDRAAPARQQGDSRQTDGPQPQEQTPEVVANNERVKMEMFAMRQADRAPMEVTINSKWGKRDIAEPSFMSRPIAPPTTREVHADRYIGDRTALPQMSQQAASLHNHRLPQREPESLQRAEVFAAEQMSPAPPVAEGTVESARGGNVRKLLVDSPGDGKDSTQSALSMAASTNAPVRPQDPQSLTSDRPEIEKTQPKLRVLPPAVSVLLSARQRRRQKVGSRSRLNRTRPSVPIIATVSASVGRSGKEDHVKHNFERPRVARVANPSVQAPLTTLKSKSTATKMEQTTQARTALPHASAALVATHSGRLDARRKERVAARAGAPSMKNPLRNRNQARSSAMPRRSETTGARVSAPQTIPARHRQDPKHASQVARYREKWGDRSSSVTVAEPVVIRQTPNQRPQSHQENLPVASQQAPSHHPAQNAVAPSATQRRTEQPDTRRNAPVETTVTPFGPSFDHAVATRAPTRAENQDRRRTAPVQVPEQNQIPFGEATQTRTDSHAEHHSLQAQTVEVNVSTYTHSKEPQRPKAPAQRMPVRNAEPHTQQQMMTQSRALRLKNRKAGTERIAPEAAVGVKELPVQFQPDNPRAPVQAELADDSHVTNIRTQLRTEGKDMQEQMRRMRNKYAETRPGKSAQQNGLISR